ncbi:hypothetical protein D3C81_952630 [compost metagenome]
MLTRIRFPEIENFWLARKRLKTTADQVGSIRSSRSPEQKNPFKKLALRHFSVCHVINPGGHHSWTWIFAPELQVVVNTIIQVNEGGLAAFLLFRRNSRAQPNHRVMHPG